LVVGVRDSEAIRASANAAMDERPEDRLKETDWAMPEMPWSTDDERESDAGRVSANAARALTADDRVVEAD
jgi:hypothetical protein